MVIIMLGNKKEQIDCRHRLVKPRVQRRGCELRIVQLFEAENNSFTYLSKGCEDLFQFPRIMVRLIGLAVAKIGGAQFGSAGQQIIKAARPKRLEIEQVACVFLH
jgi:hypothetical protein